MCVYIYIYINATADGRLYEFHSARRLFSYNTSAQMFPSLASTKLSSFDICNVAAINIPKITLSCSLKYYITLDYIKLTSTLVPTCKGCNFKTTASVGSKEWQKYMRSYLLPPPPQKKRVIKILKNSTKSV
jgi:hypothetical protein